MVKNNFKRSETFASKDSSATKIADSPYFVFFARVMSFKKRERPKSAVFSLLLQRLMTLGLKMR